MGHISVLAGILCAVLLIFVPPLPVRSQPENDVTIVKRIDELEKQLRQISEEIRILKQRRGTPTKQPETEGTPSVRVSTESSRPQERTTYNVPDWVDRFTLGGYGEMHANFGEGGSPDQFDIHRLVLYLGYDFNDWIKFHSETEIEHAYVSEDSDGELSLEQAYVDFLLTDVFNVRFGRVLTPIGIINKKHEPPTFYGVERPSFAKYIVPTTWPSDGIGLFGNLSPSLKYEAYVVGSLDRSKFDALSGIRKGRIKERPSLHEPAVTGRIDYYPFAERAAIYDQLLRLGLSSYWGGLDNGDKGINPDIDGDISIYSADFEYSVAGWDFRGVVALEDIDGALEIGNGTASEIFGWYLETGYHFWPDSWKTGKFSRADAVIFLRFDDFDTQHDMPSHVPENPAGDRTEWTMGVSFYPRPNFVLKADYQIRDDASAEDLDNLFNLGVGWQF